MEINRDKENSCLYISQEDYCKKILQKFKIENAKPMKTYITNHFKLSAENSPKEKDKKHQDYMSKIPYSQLVGSLMHLMVSTKSDLSYSTSLVSCYMANPGKQH